MRQKIAIGKILKAHGMGGSFLVHIYSGLFNEDVYERFYIKQNEGYLSLQLLEVSSYRPSKGLFLAKIQWEEVTSASSYMGPLELFVDELPYNSLEEGEFFFHDLENSQVFFEDKCIGLVKAVHGINARTVIEVSLSGSAEGQELNRRVKTVFLPFWEPFLVSFDGEKKTVVFEGIHDFL